MSESPLISFEEGGKLLGGLHHTTIRKRKAGTEMLTHVQMGRRKMLIRSEVEELAFKVIERAVEQDKERKTLLKLAS